MSRSDKVTATLFDPVAATPGSKGADEMKRYGIECIPVDYFHFGGFRYTSLREAVAQAKRVDTHGIRP